MAFTIKDDVLKKYIEEEGETEVVIPEGITKIGRNAFAFQRHLTSVKIPDGVTRIDDSAFWFCEKLASVNIPDGVTEIGDHAFDQCSLTDVTIPESVATIGSRAFGGCSFSEIRIPESVKSIGVSAFAHCRNLTSINIPESVTEIKWECFESCSSLTSITIPDSVTTIEGRAFLNCTNLAEIHIPKTVHTLGHDAFTGTRCLEDYPDDFVVINNILHHYKGKGGDVVIPDGIPVIGENVFSERSDITSVTIPSSVKKIGRSAFQECTGLSHITIPEGVTEIDWGAFMDCTNLKSVDFPESLQTIYNRAFENTPWFDQHPDDFVVINNILYQYTGKNPVAVIPEGVKAISWGAFPDYDGLEHLVIPDSVTDISENAIFSHVNVNRMTLWHMTFVPKKLKSADLNHAMEMLKTKDFSMKLNHDVKFAAIVGFYLKTGDAEAEAYIKKNIAKIMPYLIENNNADAVSRLLERTDFVTKRNIDKFIDLAISQGNTEIQTELLHYKHEQTGYTDPAKKFKL